MADQRAEIRDKIQKLLVETGERDKIRAEIEKKLMESGWNDKVKAACKDFITAKGVDAVSVEDVVTAVAPAARSTVPAEVKAAILAQLRQFLAKNQIDAV